MARWRDLNAVSLRGAYQSVLKRLRPVWSGVYRDYRDVPARGPGFNGAVWVSATRALTKRALDEVNSRRTESAKPLGDRALLPLLAASIAGERGRVGILDFGGGMGIGYIDVRGALRAPTEISYVVVETDAVCAEGRTLFVGDNSIRFVSALSSIESGVDIVHVSSALQYIDDYRALVRELALIGAPYILFVNVSAGDIPTYATAQLNVPGSVLPYWFLNRDELIGIVDEQGYSLRLETTSERRLTGFAVPLRYRLERGRNLLFARQAERPR